MHNILVSDINQSLEISLPDTISLEELRQKLVFHINHLINHDFEKLVFYLYRIDVDESKIKKLLDQKGGENAAELIADSIIERQLQKIKSRQQFSKNKSADDETNW